MEYIETKGAKIPVIGLGTWMLRGKEAQRITETALQDGYRHIDTARMYGNEASIGAALDHAAIARSELFITTKVWWEDLEPEKFQRSLEGSLADLRTDYVDLLLIHWPHPELPVESYLEQLMESREKGAAAHIGISNFTPELIEKAVATGAKLANSQVEYHPYLDQSAVLDTCRRHGISFTAYTPLAQGRVSQDPVIQQIAQQHDKTPAQVTLRWLIQQKDVIAIPKTGTPDRLTENADIFNFHLSTEEMQKISALNRKSQRFVDPEHALW